MPAVIVYRLACRLVRLAERLRYRAWDSCIRGGVDPDTGRFIP